MQSLQLLQTCAEYVTLQDFRMNMSLFGLVFMVLTHFACTLIAAPCLPPALQESPAPAMARKTLPSEDCQEKACMIQHVQC